MPDEKLKVGDIYKKLPYDNSAKMPELEEEGEIVIAEEKPAATMYGYPAQMQTKITPLHKKGKLAPSYKEDPKFFEFGKKRKARKEREAANAAKTAELKASQEGLEEAVTTITPNPPPPPKTTNKKKIKTRHVSVKI